MKVVKVLCVGFGYVGKAYALLLRELGHEVHVLTAQDDTMDNAIKYSFPPPHDRCYDVAVIAVPTPTREGQQDVSVLGKVLSKINLRITGKFEVKNIVIKSTVLPLNIIMLEEKFKLPNQRFILYPEFLEACNPIGGVFNQTCKVFGKSGKWSKKDKEFVCSLFGFKKDDVTFTNLTTASILKYVHNMWLCCNLSFWNSVIRSMANMDVNFNLVLKETHKSKYFGTHPWHIGTAYGGACLPKDIKAFISSVDKVSVFRRFIELIDGVNEEVKK